MSRKVLKRVMGYRTLIEKGRESAGLTATQYPTSLVMAIMHYESGGNPKAQNSQGASGLFQVTQTRVGDLPGVTLENIRSGNAEYQIEKFFQLSKRYRSTHKFKPDWIIIDWARGVGTVAKVQKMFKNHGSATNSFYIEYAELVGKSGSSSKSVGQNAIEKAKYLTIVQDLQAKYARELGEHPITWDVNWDVKWAEILPESMFGARDSKSVRMSQEELNHFITPEELRKGIIAQFYHISDWYLAARMADPESIAERGKDKTLSESPEAQEQNLDDGGGGDEKQKLEWDERRRYVQSLVEAEFYRRRFSSRSIPAISGPFNPYPVAGYPGLILTPGRPILAYIEQVSHQISVGGGTGTTSISCSAPRYWDEGEVWCWFGGEEKDSWLLRHFPQWHNRKVVPTNNADPKTFQRTGKSALDRFYEFMLDTTSIEYVSNNTGVATESVVEASFTSRDPGPLDVNPETLDILEYNAAIATLKDGRFAPGTLAHKFYGAHKPYDAVDKSASMERQIDYTERYGVRERPLLEGFLGNKFDKVNGRVILLGPTFGGDRVNGVQNMVIEYMKDLERRDLDGGV